MEVQIQGIRFTMSDQLRAFVEKKIERLARRYDSINTFDVTMTLVRPETANNKEVRLHVGVAGGDLISTKTADTFEEAFDVAIEGVERQLERRKEQR